MCGTTIPFDASIKAISILAKTGIPSQSFNNESFFNGKMIYAIAIRKGDADRYDSDGKALVSEKIQKGSHIILKAKNGCELIKMPIELLYTCCQNPAYVFPQGLEISAVDSSIVYKGPVADIEDGKAYELIVWYMNA